MIPEKDQKKFSAEYEEEVRELLVLTAEGVRGAAKWGGAWCPSAGLLAYIDNNGELHGSVKTPQGVLQWLIAETESGWGFGLRPTTIYRVKVRTRKGNLANDYFMLLEVLERIDTLPQLEPIRQAYLQPKTLQDPALPGVVFELDREFSWFDAELDQPNHPEETFLVYLECDDDDNENATAALANFKSFYADFANWDAKLRRHAAAGLTETANDWQEDCDDDDEDYQPITEADFAQRISLSEFNIDDEGNFTAYFDDDEMFFCHVIVIDGNLNGKLRDAYLAG